MDDKHLVPPEDSGGDASQSEVNVVVAPVSPRRDQVAPAPAAQDGGGDGDRDGDGGDRAAQDGGGDGDRDDDRGDRAPSSPATSSSGMNWMLADGDASPSDVRALYTRLRHLREYERRERGSPLERDAEREALVYCFVGCCGILPVLCTLTGVVLWCHTRFKDNALEAAATGLMIGGAVLLCFACCCWCVAATTSHWGSGSRLCGR